MLKIISRNVSKSFARKCEKECFVRIKWVEGYGELDKTFLWTTEYQEKGKIFVRIVLDKNKCSHFFLVMWRYKTKSFRKDREKFCKLIFFQIIFEIRIDFSFASATSRNYMTGWYFISNIHSSNGYRVRSDIYSWFKRRIPHHINIYIYIYVYVFYIYLSTKLYMIWLHVLSCLESNLPYVLGHVSLNQNFKGLLG